MSVTPAAMSCGRRGTITGLLRRDLGTVDGMIRGLEPTKYDLVELLCPTKEVGFNPSGIRELEEAVAGWIMGCVTVGEGNGCIDNRPPVSRLVKIDCIE